MAHSVTTQKSLFVSNVSSIWMMLSCRRVRRISISCLRFLMSCTAGSLLGCHTPLQNASKQNIIPKNICHCHGTTVEKDTPSSNARHLLALSMLHDELHGGDLPRVLAPGLVHLQGRRVRWRLLGARGKTLLQCRDSPSQRNLRQSGRLSDRHRA